MKTTSNITCSFFASNAFEFAEGSREGWVRIARWGEYPGTITHPDGRRMQGTQIIDREGAARMVEAFNSVVSKIAHFGRGLPLWEGHPDDPRWRRENPGERPVAVGRIKELQVRDDGPWMRVALNDLGYQLLAGDAPAYSAQSPRFGLEPVAGKPATYRAVELQNAGLTNFPNLPDSAIGLNQDLTHPSEPETREEDNHHEHSMKLTTAALQRLGLNPEASDDAIADAINTMADRLDVALSDAATHSGRVTTLESELTAANERATTAEAEAKEVRKDLVERTLADAINEGRITEADRPKWAAALETDYAGECEKLGKLIALNTENRLGDLGHRKTEGRDQAPDTPQAAIMAINEAVHAYAAEHKLDARTPEGYDAAFRAVRESRKELFSN